MQGFEWCEKADGAPILAWCIGSQTGHAFQQMGDGSVQVKHTPLQRKAGCKTFVVVPGEEIMVPDEMMAWAKAIMGGEQRMTLGFASGMCNSGVGPDCFLHSRSPTDSPPQAPKPSRTSEPTVLGGGSWSI